VPLEGEDRAVPFRQAGAHDRLVGRV
jgi:hypothetical protein